jgi:predicted nuclease of predicted toxin-antitoxin system
LSSSENRIVVTKDLDFLDNYMVKSKPQKLILVKTGNITNKELLEIFTTNLGLIIEMIERSSLIEIGRTYIAEHG